MRKITKRTIIAGVMALAITAGATLGVSSSNNNAQNGGDNKVAKYVDPPVG